METLREGIEQPSSDDVVSRLWKDLDRGRLLPLSEYLRLYPGNDVTVAREYLAIAGGSPSKGAADGDASDASLPVQVGPYRLLEEIGRGGQGVVFVAEDVRLKRRVALKLLSNARLLPEDALHRFRREAEVASRLDHPGICTIHETGTKDGVFYIAMRLVEGETLARRIARVRAAPEAGTTRLDVEDATGGDGADEPSRPAPVPSTQEELLAAVTLIERVARAAHVAHEAGVVHRDLKPGNVMVTPSGDPVILDFGLARDEDHDLSTLTRSGVVFGTPAYMAPEQTRGERVDRRADVWALGAMLFECVTLERPFRGPTQDLLLQAIREDPTPRPRHLNRSIPRDLEVIIATALEKDVARRYQTALHLAEDLRRLRALEPIQARPAGHWLRTRRWLQRNRVVATSFFLIVAALGAGLGVSLAALGSRETALAAARRSGIEEKNARLAETQAKEEAVRSADEARRAGVQAHLNSGALFAGNGNWEKALEAYDLAERTGPVDPTEIAIDRVHALEGAGRGPEALAILDALLARFGDRPLPGRLLLLKADLGDARSDDPRESLRSMEQALASGELGEADAAYARGYIAPTAAEARVHLEQALRADSYHRRTNELYPIVLAALMDFEALAEFGAVTCALYPEDPVAWGWRLIGLKVAGRESELRDLRAGSALARGSLDDRIIGAALDLSGMIIETMQAMPSALTGTGDGSLLPRNALGRVVSTVLSLMPAAKSKPDLRLPPHLRAAFAGFKSKGILGFARDLMTVLDGTPENNSILGAMKALDRYAPNAASRLVLGSSLVSTQGWKQVAEYFRSVPPASRPSPLTLTELEVELLAWGQICFQNGRSFVGWPAEDVARVKWLIASLARHQHVRKATLETIGMFGLVLDEPELIDSAVASYLQAHPDDASGWLDAARNDYYRGYYHRGLVRAERALDLEPANAEAANCRRGCLDQLPNVKRNGRIMNREEYETLRPR